MIALNRADPVAGARDDGSSSTAASIAKLTSCAPEYEPRITLDGDENHQVLLTAPDGNEHRHRIGSAVVDLIFSIANRDVTFFSGTAAISRL